jgi:Zn-dependent M28 family amino/carboxypeptidase
VGGRREAAGRRARGRDRGEEKGLLGADYFARHPTIAGRRIVADINLDTLLPVGPLEEAGAAGLEASSLIDDARAAARAASFTFAKPTREGADFFARGDQYAFAINGVPSAMSFVGSKAAQPVFDAWMETHYHQPSDEWRPEFQSALAVQRLRFDFLFGLAVASDDAAPRWNADSPFRR